jgi:hypothetical protein
MFLQPLDPVILRKIQSRIEELGIPIPVDYTAVVAAAAVEWMTKTTDGKEYFVRLFGFDWEGGESDMVYENTMKKESYRGDQIYFLKAAVANGEFLPPSQIDPVKMDKEGCAECGVLAHCTKEIKGGHQVCNYCMANSSDLARRDQSGGMKMCESCTVQLCQHYPHRSVAQLYKLYG